MTSDFSNSNLHKEYSWRSDFSESPYVSRQFNGWLPMSGPRWLGRIEWDPIPVNRGTSRKKGHRRIFPLPDKVQTFIGHTLPRWPFRFQADVHSIPVPDNCTIHCTIHYQSLSSATKPTVAVSRSNWNHCSPMRYAVAPSALSVLEQSGPEWAVEAATDRVGGNGRATVSVCLLSVLLQGSFPPNALARYVAMPDGIIGGWPISWAEEPAGARIQLPLLTRGSDPYSMDSQPKIFVFVTKNNILKSTRTSI